MQHHETSALAPSARMRLTAIPAEAIWQAQDAAPVAAGLGNMSPKFGLRVADSCALTAVCLCLSAVTFAQPLPVPGGDGRGGEAAIPNQTTKNSADVPAVDDSGGLYVVVEASSRPLDALYVVAPLCGTGKVPP